MDAVNFIEKYIDFVFACAEKDIDDDKEIQFLFKLWIENKGETLI